ncbi:MAG: CHAT domain-containing protein [Vicinamibacteria bacterium]
MPGGAAREEQLFGELALLRDERSRRAFLARHKGLRRAEVVARLCEQVPRRIRVDLQEALALAEAAQALARSLRSPKAAAQSLRAKGNALYALRRFREAVAHHREAAALFEQLGLAGELGRTLSTSLQPLILLGEYDAALAAADRAREIFEAGGDALRLARLELNLGNVYHRQDRFAEALERYERAYERLAELKDAEGIAVALGNMSMCLITLNDFARALDTHTRARAFCQEQGLPGLVALADYNIAYLHYFRGQYATAIGALRAIRESSARSGDAYRAALCYLDLAEIYLELNASEDATEMADEAGEAFERLGMGYEHAKALCFAAIAHGQQGRMLRALELFARARGLFVAEQNQVWPALIDLYQALLLFDAGRLPEARRACLAALAAFESAGLASKAVLCRLLLARLALRVGDVAGARQEHAQAGARFSADELPALGFQARFLEARIEEAAGDEPRAYAAYRAAQASLETLRSSLRGEELKIAFMKDKLEVYESLVELALRRGPAGLEEAWGYVEQAKSRSLLDLVLRGAPSAGHGAAGKSELVRRVGELRDELNWYYHRIEAEQLTPESRTAERLQRLHSQVREREDQLLRALRELPAGEAEQRALYVPTSLPLDAIRRALPQDALIVEYFRVGQRLVAFLAGRSTLEAVPVTHVARVRHLLRLLQFQLAWARPAPGRRPKALEESHRLATLAHLQELHHELLAPLGKRLKAQHLVFVPHGPLHYVPFHALHDGRRHLLDAYSVSYAPSASIFALCQGRRPAAGGSLVLGVPDVRAPFILQEAQAVAARLPRPELLLGAGATVQALREKGEACRFVHLASHGFFRGDNPMFSGVRLGASYLTLYDLYGLRLPAELVTLSACVSGLSAVAAGDELLGLARGLFSAGAASLLTTLWEVPDESTAEFMKSFYDSYLRESNKAVALREAALALREQFPHPLHWAPFTLAGKVFV